jgi:predicted metalloendopeptidase
MPLFPLRAPAAALALALAGASAAAAEPVPSACTDFDAYVNGRWHATTELPAHRSRVGSFDTLRSGNAALLEKALAALVAEPARQTSPGLRLLAAYHASGMDTAAIEQQGLAPVAPWLARIAALTREELPALLGDLARLQVAAPLSLSVGSDALDADRHALIASAAGLGLPDRDDYLRGDDERSKTLIAAYRDYARTLLEAAGAPADAATLDALLAFETELARAAPTRVQRRDPRAGYNPYTVEGLRALDAGYAWQAWLSAYTGRAEGAPLIVAAPAFAAATARLAQHAPLATWQAYLRVRLLDATAEHLPRRVAQAHFAYRGTAVRGLRTPLPRAEQTVLAIGGAYGGAPLAETLGELYAASAFSPQAQARAEQMLDDIRQAMRQRIDALPWMSEPTKQLARAKLDAMRAKIGVPERWRRYEGLVLDAADYAGNLLRVNAWHTAQRLAQLDQPVDRGRWTTSPHIVNAFAAGGNQIVFPAAILQPPFFDPAADDASNYGAIGMVIGHEITHHFDDRGRQFDASGNLRDWWQPADADAYRQRAERVAALYAGFEPVRGVRIDGRLTLGENISDLGGVQIAYEGLQLALARQRAAGREPPLVDGMTPEQRFFMANATIWRSKTRPEALVNQLRTDSHSPGRFRVLAPLSNMPAFAQAFGCRAGDAMVAAEPIQIW